MSSGFLSQDRIQQRIVEQTIPVIPLAEKIVELLVHSDATECERVCFNTSSTQSKWRSTKSSRRQCREWSLLLRRRSTRRPSTSRFHRCSSWTKLMTCSMMCNDRYPWPRQCRKLWRFPLSQFNDKVVDIPVVARREVSQLQVIDVPVVLGVQASQSQAVAETAEIPQLQVTDQVVDVPVVVVAQVPQVHVETKTVEITQLQPVEQVPHVHVVKKTVEDPQFQIVEKTAEDPRTQTIQDDLNSADSKCEVLFHVNKQSLDFASGVHVDTVDFDVDEDGQKIMSVVAPRAAAQHRSVR